MSFKKIVVILLHAFAGWALCAATMGIGMAATSLQTALIVHAIAAPIYFGVVSYIYFSRFGYTRPLPTAVIFVAFVMIVDFLVVALLINKSLSMFGSLWGPGYLLRSYSSQHHCRYRCPTTKEGES